MFRHEVDGLSSRIGIVPGVATSDVDGSEVAKREQLNKLESVLDRLLDVPTHAACTHAHMRACMHARTCTCTNSLPLSPSSILSLCLSLSVCLPLAMNALGSSSTGPSTCSSRSPDFWGFG